MVCKINDLFFNFFKKKFQKDLVDKEKGSTFAPAKENDDEDKEREYRIKRFRVAIIEKIKESDFEKKLKKTS